MLYSEIPYSIPYSIPGIIGATRHQSSCEADNSTRYLSKPLIHSYNYIVNWSIYCIGYRVHIQAIIKHVVYKVAHISLDLALEFGISEKDAIDLVKDGNGQIKIFRIWLRKGCQTWKNLVDLLHKLNEKQLADELQDKVKRKGN